MVYKRLTFFFITNNMYFHNNMTCLKYYFTECKCLNLKDRLYMIGMH